MERTMGVAVQKAHPKHQAHAKRNNSIEGGVELPDGSKRSVSVLDMTTYLVQAMPRADLPWRGKAYNDCFKGCDGVDALMKCFRIRDRERAILFGRTLQRKQILRHVGGSQIFGDSSFYFRLQPFHEPNVLNTFCIWTDRVDPDPSKLIEKLHGLLKRLILAVTNSRGAVDYKTAAHHPLFLQFEGAVCELQGVLLCGMDENTMKAFALNLHNLMTTHAHIKFGACDTSTRIRGSSFLRNANISYNIGGDTLTCDDVEHGILRGNRRGRHAFSPAPFPQDDSKIRLALKEMDPRVHFAISCGAKSFSTLKSYNGETIEQDLQSAAETYCQDDEKVRVDFKQGELTLNPMFQFYQADFTDCLSKMPEYIVQYLRGDKKYELQELLKKTDGRVKLKFKRLDIPKQPSNKSLSFRRSKRLVSNAA